jgi:hypothetical protein
LRRIVKWQAWRRCRCYRPLDWARLGRYEIVWRYSDLVLLLGLRIDKGKVVIGEIVILVTER